MAKQTKYIFGQRKIPEWGVSPVISTAVPIAASGAEIKSTRVASQGIFNVLTSRVKATPVSVDDMAKLKKVFSQSGAKRKSGPSSFLEVLVGAKADTNHLRAKQISGRTYSSKRAAKTK
jgi:hypothetical protein